MNQTPADTRSRDELITCIQKGATPKYVLFWGHQPKIPGQIDLSCLSNWFPSPFEIDGLRYATSEHYMMAAKARLFGDTEILADILAADDPGKAKALGRQIRHFNEEVWQAQRFDIVVEGNTAKFAQNEAMGEFLRQTGSKVLVEASPRDRIWGIGMGRNHEAAQDPTRWRGKNLLGFALMEVRARLACSPI